VGLEVPSEASPPPLLSEEGFSPADAPPELEDSELPPVPSEEGSSEPPLPSEDSSLEPVVVVLLVVVVEVVCTAAFSALVLLGGVISGVLLGTASVTLLPPQAASVNPHKIARQPASAIFERAPKADQAGLAGWPGGPMRRPQVGQSLRSF
jgi:hypothetical protein